MEKPQIILYASKSLNYTLFDSKWVPYSAKFVVLGNHARGTGALQIYELSSGDVKLVKEVRSMTHISKTIQQISRSCFFFINWFCLQTEKPKAFKCGTFGAAQMETRHLATGDFDGNLNIWSVISRFAIFAIYSSTNNRLFVKQGSREAFDARLLGKSA